MFNLYLCLIFYIKIALPTRANKVDRLCIGWFQRILGFFLCIDGVLSFPVMRKHGYLYCTYTLQCTVYSTPRMLKPLRMFDSHPLLCRCLLVLPDVQHPAAPAAPVQVRRVPTATAAAPVSPAARLPL